MTGAHGPARLIDDAERFLVAGLNLRPVDLPPELRDAYGRWKDHPVRIVARAYASGIVRYARFVTIEGAGLWIGNLLALPAATLSAPILGADLVAFPGRPTMVAVDLSPIRPSGPERAAMEARVAAALGPRPALPSGGELPAWCSALFSPSALYTRVDPSDLDDVAAAFHQYPRAFTSLIQATRPQPELRVRNQEGQDAYAMAHRIEDKGLRLLAKMFGQDWAERFLSEVLFPSGGWPVDRAGVTRTDGRGWQRAR